LSETNLRLQQALLTNQIIIIIMRLFILRPKMYNKLIGDTIRYPITHYDNPLLFFDTNLAKNLSPNTGQKTFFVWGGLAPPQAHAWLRPWYDVSGQYAGAKT